MVKKLEKNEKEKKNDGEFITRLYEAGESPIKIARKYGFSKQKVNYWIQKFKKGIKNKGTRKRKLSDEYLDLIVGLAKNKTTSFMGERRITSIINKKLERKKETYKTGKKNEKS